WFCQPHAAEYNRGWNFFAGLNEEQIRARQADEAVTGGRPTWTFKAGRGSREAAAAASRGFFRDAFGIFGRQGAQSEAAERAAYDKRLGRLERGALADLDLDATADAATIRRRYTELLKRCHPDANGGDRSTEHKLQRVIKAFRTLRKAKLA
ncbi:MAG: J domain-containing protein, partial [Methylocella sp.]